MNPKCAAYEDVSAAAFLPEMRTRYLAIFVAALD